MVIETDNIPNIPNPSPSLTRELWWSRYKYFYLSFIYFFGANYDGDSNLGFFYWFVVLHVNHIYYSNVYAQNMILIFLLIYYSSVCIQPCVYSVLCVLYTYVRYNVPIYIKYFGFGSKNIYKDIEGSTNWTWFFIYISDHLSSKYVYATRIHPNEIIKFRSMFHMFFIQHILKLVHNIIIKLDNFIHRFNVFITEYRAKK